MGYLEVEDILIERDLSSENRLSGSRVESPEEVVGNSMNIRI